MPEVSERVQLVQATFAGLKDLALGIAAIASIFYGAEVSGKLDVQSVKTEQVKETLKVSSELRDQKLADIAKHAEAADQKIGAWKAEYERPAAAVAPPPP